MDESRLDPSNDPNAPLPWDTQIEQPRLGDCIWCRAHKGENHAPGCAGVNPPSIIGDDITSDGRSPSELILEAFGEASALFMSNPKPGTSQTMPEHALANIATRLHDALFVPVENAAKADRSYEAQVRDEPNRAMRKASGEIDDKRNLVTFFYLLGRNSMPLGAIEELVRESTMGGDENVQFTNGWLAQWAQYTTDLLTGHAVE